MNIFKNVFDLELSFWGKYSVQVVDSYLELFKHGNGSKILEEDHDSGS